MLHSLISATARLHTCLRGAIDQDLNLKFQITGLHNAITELFDDHDHCEGREIKTVWKQEARSQIGIFKLETNHDHCEGRKIGTVWKLAKKIKEARSSLGRN